MKVYGERLIEGYGYIEDAPDYDISIVSFELDTVAPEGSKEQS